MSLFGAFIRRDLEEFRNLLENGANPNDRNEYGYTLLMKMSYEGQYREAMEFYEILIDYGADVNLQDHNGETSLMWESCYGHEHYVRLLLENGADPDIVNNEGKKAIDFAENKYAKELLSLPGPKRAEKN